GRGDRHLHPPTTPLGEEQRRESERRAGRCLPPPADQGRHATCTWASGPAVSVCSGKHAYPKARQSPGFGGGKSVTRWFDMNSNQYISELTSHPGDTLRHALKVAAHLGCFVEQRRRTGEVLVSHPNLSRKRLRVNARRKDAPRHLTRFLRKLTEMMSGRLGRKAAAAGGGR